MADDTSCQQDMPDQADDKPQSDRYSNTAPKEYFTERVPVFKRLCRLRDEGWNSTTGDAFFAKQRQVADKQKQATKIWHFKSLQWTAAELDQYTGVFSILRDRESQPGQPRGVLDFCMAPGGFLKAAMERDPEIQVTAFTLPDTVGGHEILLDAHLREKINLRMLDVTMLSEDMGVSPTNISYHYAQHIDRRNFLPQQLPHDLKVDLVLCDGQVLRTHSRAAYREPVEATRLISVQLALGLEHLRPGGTMLIMQHRFELWDSLTLLHTLSKFSDDVRVHKPSKAHSKRSSYYVVAKNVQSQSLAAKEAIGRWKNTWRIATFGTPEEIRKVRTPSVEKVDELLEEFGTTLVRLGVPVWRTQAEALSKAPFIKR